MREMGKVLLLLLVSLGILGGQGAADVFDQAPPDVDKALRANVSKYYQAFVDGKFRQAAMLVADDSQEGFFAMEKRRYRGFEIVKISYSDKFTRASVVTAIDTDIALYGNTLPVKAPVTTTWKVEEGEWLWYMDPNAGRAGPTGILKGGPAASGGTAGPFSVDRAAKDILKQVKVDKSEVRLSSFEPSSDTVLISNAMPGVVTIRLDCEKAAGLEFSLDRQELKQGETAKVTFKYNPPNKSPKPALNAKLMVSPLGSEFPLRLVFAIPAEIDKQIPKQ
jgi:hypothetical protein